MSQEQPERSADTLPLIPILVLFGGITLLMVVLFSARPSGRAGESVAVEPTAAVAEVTPETAVEAPSEPTVEPTVAAGEQAQPQTVALDPARVSAGDNTYHSVCAACHGYNAEGIPGLGKPLVGSEFVNTMSDEELLTFIIVGRDARDPLNTTGVPMPARGGNPGLTDNNLLDVIAWIRSQNLRAGYGPQPVGGAVAQAASPTPLPPTVEPPTPSGPTATPTEFATPESLEEAAAEAPAPSEPLTAVRAEELFTSHSQMLYVRACAGCHGVDGQGVPSILGSNLNESVLLQERDGVAMLMLFIESNPDLAFQHPLRGGYPQLTDEQLLEIIGYTYSLVSSN